MVPWFVRSCNPPETHSEAIDLENRVDLTRKKLFAVVCNDPIKSIINGYSAYRPVTRDFPSRARWCGSCGYRNWGRNRRNINLQGYCLIYRVVSSDIGNR